MQKFTVQTAATVRKALDLPSHSSDHFALYDSPGEAARDAVGAERFAPSDEVIAKSELGDLSLVAESDKLLAQYEGFAIETRRNRLINDVTGAIPNVPAYLAGHPLAMRRRAKSRDEAGSIAIVADLGFSCMVNGSDAAKRGAAILALARILSATRPLELWVGDCSGEVGGTKMVGTFARIDTTPLDLARAAYCLVSLDYVQRVHYAIANKEIGFTGQWPYAKGAAYRKHLPTILAPAFAHTEKTIFIGGMHRADDSVGNPLAWINERLVEAGQFIESAAA
jgi:hypothetical protein